MDIILDKIHEIVMLPSAEWTYVKTLKQAVKKRVLYPSTRRLNFPFSWLMTALSTVAIPCSKPTQENYKNSRTFSTLRGGTKLYLGPPSWNITPKGARFLLLKTGQLYNEQFWEARNPSQIHKHLETGVCI